MSDNLITINVGGKEQLIVNSGDKLIMETYNPTTTTTTTTISPCESGYTIGAYIGGGVVAYIFTTNDYGYISGYTSGIIAATIDVSSAVWGCSSTFIGSTNSGVGYGSLNSGLIYDNCYVGTPIAAYNCITYYDGGYENWMLGTVGDMVKVFNNKEYIPNLSLTGISSYYYTSTEINSTTAFQITTIDSSYINSLKSSTKKVRPIRYFSVIACP